MQKAALLPQEQTDPFPCFKGGEDGEGQDDGSQWMLGIDVYVTCGDLALMSHVRVT